jgi:hypothetical protein
MLLVACVNFKIIIWDAETVNNFQFWMQSETKLKNASEAYSDTVKCIFRL